MTVTESGVVKQGNPWKRNISIWMPTVFELCQFTESRYCLESMYLLISSSPCHSMLDISSVTVAVNNAQNANCSWDIYVQFTKVRRSVILRQSCFDAMTPLWPLVTGTTSLHSILGSYISPNRFGADVHVCFHRLWQLRFDRTCLCVSLNFIRFLRVVFPSQQRLNRRAVNVVQWRHYYSKTGWWFWLVDCLNVRIIMHNHEKV